MEEIGIDHVRPKISATGAIILEFPGEESAAGADRLAEKLRSALSDKAVRVARPVKCADIRVSGLDDSITKEDLAIALAGAGGCAPTEVKVGDVRRGPNGLGTVWA